MSTARKRLISLPGRLTWWLDRHAWTVVAVWGMVLILATIAGDSWSNTPDPAPPSAETTASRSEIALLCANSEQAVLWQGTDNQWMTMNSLEAARLSQRIGQCYLSIWQGVPFAEVSAAAAPGTDSLSLGTEWTIAPEAIQRWLSGVQKESPLQQVASSARESVVRAERLALPIGWVILLLATRNGYASLVPLVVGGITSHLSVMATSGLVETAAGSDVALSVIAMLGLALGIDYGLLCTRWFWQVNGLQQRHTTYGTIWTAAAAVGCGALALLVIPVASIQFLAVGVVFVTIFGAMATVTLVPALATLLRAPRRMPQPGREPDTRAAAVDFPGLSRARAGLALIACVGLLALVMQVTRMDTGLSNPLISNADSDVVEPYASYVTREMAEVQLSTLTVQVYENSGDQVVPAIVREFGADADFAPLVVRQHDLERDDTRLFALIVHQWEEEATQSAIRRWQRDILPTIAAETNSEVSLAGPLLAYRTTLDVLATWQYAAGALAAVGTLSLLWLIQRRLWLACVAVGGSILSTLAALGGLVLLAESSWEWFAQPIEIWVPVVTFCVLMGLGVDYHVFLTSGVSKDAVTLGDTTVVQASACVMLVVFGALTLADQQALRQIGMALALGVAIDAFVVRLLFYPVLRSMWSGNRVRSAN